MKIKMIKKCIDLKLLFLAQHPHEPLAHIQACRVRFD